MAFDFTLSLNRIIPEFKPGETNVELVSRIFAYGPG
jgi:hypothetical protein